MEPLAQLLVDNPLLTLFLVAGIGYPLGRLRFGGASLGVAAVLFVGLAVGASSKIIKLPEIIQQLGLVMFVYTLGLSSGPGFVAAFKKRGFQASFLTVLALLVTLGVWFLAARHLGISSGLAAGGFTGSVTNTAGLAAVIELARGSLDPAVGYSITYRMGVIGLMIVMAIFGAHLRRQNRLVPPKNPGLTNATYIITNPQVFDKTIEDVMELHANRVVFGRLKRGSQMLIAESGLVLQEGDLLSVVGSQDSIDQLAPVLGAMATERLDLDRTQFDYRRYFISNPSVYGKTLSDLQLPQNFGAVMTRVSRGDVEFLPEGNTALEPGDRVRVLTHRDNFPEIKKLLGDSYKALSEIDILGFGLGICIGIMLGMIQIHLPGGLMFKLGVAGGPLVVSLVLGAIHQTGPIYWGLSFSANLTLRQIGLILFLAGVGVRSGYGFREALMSNQGLIVLGTGIVATMATATIFLLIASKVFKVSGATLMGMVAAVHTQPAALGFAVDQTKSDLPNTGYATVFPIASVSKIILAQVLYQLLR